METNLTKWLKSNGNPNPQKDCPDKDKLHRLYVLEKKGSWAIAEHFGVTQRLILIWLKREGIKTRTKSEANKISATGFKSNEKHPNWVGDKVSYSALHAWVKSHRGTPKICEYCQSTMAKKYEWANLSGVYKRDLSDWARLCTKCHRKLDKNRVKS